MENLFKRHANLSLLVVVLFAQVLGLAVQIKVDNADHSTRLIRRWAVAVISPLQKVFVYTHLSVSNTWHGYFWLRGVRQENAELRAQLDQMKLEQVRLKEDADQARRIQHLLGFKEQYISKTVAAQVIGSSGSEHSRLVYIDKGSKDGLKPDLPVITPQGVVGKTIEVEPTTSQVLLINDQSSGIGAIFSKSRLQGILKGAPGGATMLNYIMADETIKPGDEIVTSGGDRIFPKGLPIGRVSSVAPGKEMFLAIRVAPAANLSQIEEVLVITEVKESAPDVDLSKGPIRAADILAERLPSVPPKAVEGSVPGASTPGTQTPGAQTPGRTTPSTQPVSPSGGASTAGATPKANNAEGTPSRSAPAPAGSAQPNANGATTPTRKPATGSTLPVVPGEAAAHKAPIATKRISPALATGAQSGAATTPPKTVQPKPKQQANPGTPIPEAQ